MAYSVPSTAAGGILTDAIWNASVRDNILYLKDRVDNPPYARVTHNTTQSIANSTDTVLAFNSETVDTAALHDTATNNGRITIPTGEDGYWQFVALVEFAANATGQRKVTLRHNGGGIYGQTQIDAAAAGNATWITVSIILNPGAGDYMEVVVAQNSGGALNVTASCQFSAVRIG